MRSLDPQVLLSHYARGDVGQRDYDVGVWLKIRDVDSNGDDQHNQAWSVDDVKAWHSKLLQDTQLAVDGSFVSVKGRIRDIILEWQRVRVFIPAEEKLVLAEDVFRHVNMLR